MQPATSQTCLLQNHAFLDHWTTNANALGQVKAQIGPQICLLTFKRSLNTHFQVLPPRHLFTWPLIVDPSYWHSVRNAVRRVFWWAGRGTIPV